MIKPRELKPTYARVLIEKLKKEEEVTPSGLLITAGVKHEKYSPNMSGGEMMKKIDIEEEDNAYEALVIAKGPQANNVQVKERVLVGKYAGFEVQKESNLFMINETDIIAII